MRTGLGVLELVEALLPLLELQLPSATARPNSAATVAIQASLILIVA